MKNVTRSLAVDLSDLEVQDFAMTLAVKISNLRMIKEEKKLSAKHFSDTIKDLNIVIDEHARRVNTKKDIRPISCVWRLAANGQTKELIRTDTAEVVEVDVATDADRQEAAVLHFPEEA